MRGVKRAVARREGGKEGGWTRVAHMTGMMDMARRRGLQKKMEMLVTVMNQAIITTGTSLTSKDGKKLAAPPTISSSLPFCDWL